MRDIEMERFFLVTQFISHSICINSLCMLKWSILFLSKYPLHQEGSE